MKLDSSIVAANVPNLSNYFLPSKVTSIGTVIVVIGVTLLGEYRRLTKSLEALRLLMSDIDKATRDTITGSIALNAQFLNEVNESRYQFERAVSHCRVRFYGLSNASWLVYPFALIRLHWAVRASKREGQALLNKIKMHGERENMQRLDWREMAGLRKRNI
ncbi:hypothetical protein C8J56DRAFT_903364 [Mycena floridula]|nr:hypothetical protein C8J56DRAFT_903364 [Mycena floridula]